MAVSRRDLLIRSSAVALGFAGLRALTGEDVALAQPKLEPAKPAEKLFDLPKGFTCRAISRYGETMADGLRTPGLADGMAAFAGPDGKTILIRNHELTSDQRKAGPFGDDNKLLKLIGRENLYDAGTEDKYANLGGTTTIVYDTAAQRTERVFLSLAGTCRNCAGGPTPWNSWITCEETVQLPDEEYAQPHGYNFDVPATIDGGPFKPVPLKAMGRFNHEAVAVDPKTGIVYQTEDRGDGLIYRFIPTTPGKLAEGGKLQALVVRGKKSCDTRNWWKKEIAVGQAVDVEWVDMENIDSPDDDMRYFGSLVKGAARFARGEGMWHGSDGIYFACTTGGSNRRGQVFRYIPSASEGQPGEAEKPGKLELFLEPNDHKLCENCDNVTIAPWGDLFLCEDHALKRNSSDQFILRVTPQGTITRFARNAMNSGEIAGVTFSPDGTTLFANIFNPGVTVAITGPWRG